MQWPLFSFPLLWAGIMLSLSPVYLGRSQCFMGKEPSCKPISYWLGNAIAMFNGKCLKEVPCWWPSQLMCPWDHSNQEVPQDNTALSPKWLLVEFHRSFCFVTWVEQLRELGKGCVIILSSLSPPLPLLIMQIWSGPEENDLSSHFYWFISFILLLSIQDSYCIIEIWSRLLFCPRIDYFFVA